MSDNRITKLSQVLVNHSIKVKPKEKILITAYSYKALPLAKECYKLCLTKGAFPKIDVAVDGLDYFFYTHANKFQLEQPPDIALYLANWADKFIRIAADVNDRELADIDPKKIMLRSKIAEPVKNVILKKPWILTDYPTNSMAQTAGMSLEALEDFYFTACLQDYNAMDKVMRRLKAVMDKGSVIEVVGDKTHLKLGVKGRLAKTCSAEFNIPDGEVYLAPLEKTVEGHIYFEFPSLRQGNEVQDVRLEFKQGKVVKASASKNAAYLNAALDTDQGSRYLGEFSFGVNYGITKGMLNTLFDEKIGGTIHMALGSAYFEKEGGGTNKSALHWDLVKDMRKKGSVVTIDGKPVLKEGKLLV